MLTKVMSIYITLVQGCIEIMSQHPIETSLDKSRNIPALKQPNIHEQKNPSMKSQFWNPQTRSRVGISPNANGSHLP